MGTSEADSKVYTRRHWAKWAKSDGDTPGRIHLLEHHLADVGACFEALLELPSIRRRLACAADLAELDDATAARLAVFAALHDIGKVNAGFQTKVWPAEDLRGKGRRWRGTTHDSDIVPVITNEDKATADWFFNALPWWDDMILWDNKGGAVVCGLFVATLSHHGRPLQLQGGRSRNPDAWLPVGELSPEECARRIGRLVREWFPKAFAADAPPLPSSPRFQHLFLGLCNWADWLGSNEEWFGYVDTPHPDYIDHARDAAKRAIRAVGLDIAAQRKAVKSANIPAFAKLFGIDDGAPNAIQRAARDTPLTHPLAIIESETGSGKTEAALWRFARMYEQRLVDGLYFALPTRAAAAQIHGRVQRFIDALLPEEHRPPVVLAVPGYHPGSGAGGVAMQDYDAMAAGHSDADSKPADKPWAAENPKRYLAAQIAVGTVDQAMLGALQVRNAHMRAACLARNLLVVDEVHASDTYMSEVLDALLTAHLGAGGYALLMSATLGSAARDKWLERERGNARVTPLGDAIDAPYPAVSSYDGDGRSEIKAAGENDRPKQVGITAEPRMGEFGYVARVALEAARAGAKVLVIRNTVGHAIDTQRALEELAGADDDAPLFSVNGVRTLHHGRFAAGDRALLDARVEALFGKKRESGGRVVVGTQTLEQSLDIDADLLITDLCPVDVLLQRIGRLHRHGRGDRPVGYEEARCVVLTPPGGDLSPLLSSGSAANGLGPHGYVYRDLRVLEATRRLIEEYGEWDIPAMNRLLVENATHPERLGAITREMGDDWAANSIGVEGEKIADAQLARLHTIRWDKAFYADNRDVLFVSDDENIRTRLGDDRVEVGFEGPQVSPFDGEASIDALALALRWLGGAEVGEAVKATRRGGERQDGFGFAVGERRFVYDRLGLRRG